MWSGKLEDNVKHSELDGEEKEYVKTYKQMKERS